MGYGIQRFTNPVDPNLLCGICNNVLEEAVLTPCGHTFCESCIHTWLRRPSTASCPVCRGSVYADDVKPVHAIRNLVTNFDVECEFTSRGCTVVMKLDRLFLHQADCSSQPVTCAACGDVVNKADLLEHQLHCVVIAASAHDHRRATNAGADSGLTFDQDSSLIERMSSMENELKILKRQLRVAESRNRVLEREYETIKTELKQRRDEIYALQYRDFDFQYKYGQRPDDVAALALFLSRFLRDKPACIDRNRVFEAIRNCYDKYSRSGDAYENDAYMLLATAYATDWFSEDQSMSLHCWLQSIARHRQYACRTAVHI